jgi:hypothetical protein
MALSGILYKIVAMLIALLMSSGCISGISGDYAVIHKTPQDSRVFHINDDEKDIGDYQHIEDAFFSHIESSGIYDYEVYDASELSTDILESRNGKTIIERCVGFVTDDTDGNEHGVVLNAFDPDFNYIGYRECAEVLCLNEGTVVVSYMIYNPDNNFIDDITERYDYVVCREYED